MYVYIYIYSIYIYTYIQKKNGWRSSPVILCTAFMEDKGHSNMHESISLLLKPSMHQHGTDPMYVHAHVYVCICVYLCVCVCVCVNESISLLVKPSMHQYRTDPMYVHVRILLPYIYANIHIHTERNA